MCIRDSLQVNVLAVPIDKPHPQFISSNLKKNWGNKLRPSNQALLADKQVWFQNNDKLWLLQAFVSIIKSLDRKFHLYTFILCVYYKKLKMLSQCDFF